jgi:hypothetical protein
MPRTRAEIQNDVNTYRASVESNDLSLNDPMWDNKFDPNYLSVKKARDEAASNLASFEKELAEAKERGEEGRPLEEIRKEISETETKVDNYRLIINRATNPMQRAMSNMAARLLQCTVNALKLELNEAIKERAGKGKVEIEKIQQLNEGTLTSTSSIYFRR